MEEHDNFCIPVAENEDARIRVLYETRLLDSLPEEMYDRYTTFARRIFKTSIALISLVDHQRVWFKSKLGLSETQGDRNVSFCSYAILEKRKILVIPDTKLDKRFENNPFVKGEAQLRFYAGAVLIIDNVKIGTLCIVDEKPRTFTDRDEEKLIGLADIVRDLIVERRQSYLENLSLTLASVSRILQPLKLPLETFQQNYQQLVAISKENNSSSPSSSSFQQQQIDRVSKQLEILKVNMQQLSYINESVIEVLLMYSKLSSWIGSIPKNFDVSSSIFKEEAEAKQNRIIQFKNFFGKEMIPLDLMKEIKNLKFTEDHGPSCLATTKVLGSNQHHPHSPSSASAIQWILEDSHFLSKPLYTYTSVLRLVLSLFTKLHEKENHEEELPLKLKIMQTTINKDEGNLTLMIVTPRPAASPTSMKYPTTNATPTSLRVKDLHSLDEKLQSCSPNPPPAPSTSSILYELFSALDNLFSPPISTHDPTSSSLSNSPAQSSSKLSETTSVATISTGTNSRSSFFMFPGVSRSILPNSIKMEANPSINDGYDSSYCYASTKSSSYQPIQEEDEENVEERNKNVFSAHSPAHGHDKHPDNDLIIYELTIPYFLYQKRNSLTLLNQIVNLSNKQKNHKEITTPKHGKKSSASKNTVNGIQQLVSSFYRTIFQQPPKTSQIHPR